MTLNNFFWHPSVCVIFPFFCPQGPISRAPGADGNLKWRKYWLKAFVWHPATTWSAKQSHFYSLNKKYRGHSSHRINKKTPSLRQSWPKYIDSYSNYKFWWVSCLPLPPRVNVEQYGGCPGHIQPTLTWGRGGSDFSSLSQYFWPWLSEWGSFLIYSIWRMTSIFFVQVQKMALLCASCRCWVSDKGF